MIGKLVIGKQEAVLTDDGWQSNDPEMAKFLNQFFSIENNSPADGALGLKQLEEAGKELNAQVVYGPRRPPAEEGQVVY